MNSDSIESIGAFVCKDIGLNKHDKIDLSRANSIANSRTFSMTRVLIIVQLLSGYQ